MRLINWLPGRWEGRNIQAVEVGELNKAAETEGEGLWTERQAMRQNYEEKQSTRRKKQQVMTSTEKANWHSDRKSAWSRSTCNELLITIPGDVCLKFKNVIMTTSKQNGNITYFYSKFFRQICFPSWCKIGGARKFSHQLRSSKWHEFSACFVCWKIKYHTQWLNGNEILGPNTDLYCTAQEYTLLISFWVFCRL